AAALARCGSPTALAVIRDARDRGDQEQKKIAAWILGLLGGPEDVEPLRRNAAAEKDPLARAYAIHALALLGDAEGRKGLGRNLRSGSAAIRTYAAEFAGYAGVREERARLIRLLDDSNVDVRVRAAQALGMLDQPPTKRDEVVVQDVFPPSPRQPRYSEGSLLALTDGTLLYATTEFLGGGEDHATAHIVARRSADGGRTWGPPTELQANTGRQNVMSVTLRRLLPGRADGPIGMVYLVKNGPNDLHAFLRISQDEARRWGPAIRITGEAGYHVVNNDRLTVLQSGRLLCPVAASPDFQQLNHFVSYCYLSDDRGQTWRRGKGSVDQPRRGAMEPEVVELTGGRLLMICRTQLGIVAASYSQDGGDTWGTPFSLTVRAPESPQTIRRIPATGDLLLVWNNSFQGSADHGGQRTPLTVAVSSDEGRSWRRVRDLEVSQEHGYAYTSVTFVQDRVLFTYYVHDVGTGRIGSRFRSVPVGWLYQ
ncbi:MAG: sialidase, partial [Armatimonadetes bacterium]|nr:sialidase [Armatimonadota bacterium]